MRERTELFLSHSFEIFLGLHPEFCFMEKYTYPQTIGF